MKIQDRIRKHLIDYRTANGLTQPGMAEFTKIGYRTYQKIEATGKVSMAEDLISIIEKTAFNVTQEVAGKEDITDIKLAVRFLIEREIQSEMNITGKTEAEIRTEFRKTMIEVYGVSLEDL